MKSIKRGKSGERIYLRGKQNFRHVICDKPIGSSSGGTERISRLMDLEFK